MANGIFFTVCTLLDLVISVLFPGSYRMNDLAVSYTHRVQEENDYLKEQLSMTENYQALYENAQRENRELQELLNMNESLSDFNIISATVIGRDVSYWNDQITLNVGSNDGIQEDMILSLIHI